MRRVVGGLREDRTFPQVDGMHGPETRAGAAIHGIGDFSRPSIALFFLAVLGIVAIPVVTHTFPPLSDYINHLGRGYIINHIDTDPYFARYYFTKWQVLPNLMIDLFMFVLLPFMDVYRAGQVFTLTAFVLTLSGTLALNRALYGRWSALPLVAAPLLYNGVLLVGVMNYIFGIGLTLWAFAAWVACRERHWPQRLLVSTAFSVALFFCHLYAVGIYGLLVLAYELHLLHARRAERLSTRLLEFFAAGLPFLPVLALLSASPTLRAVNDFYWMADGKLLGLSLAVSVYYDTVAFVLVGGAAAATVWAYRRRILHFHPAGWVILVVGAIVYIAMPRAIFAAHLADQRLPIALAFVLIACFRAEFRQLVERRVFAGLVIALLTIRIAEVQVVWDRLALVSAAFHRSVMLLKRGARVLVVHGDRSSGKDVSDFELMHAASLATIERSALVSTTFTVKGKQILHVRDEFRKYVETEDRLPPSLPYFLEAADHDVPYFFTRWPRHYDYVYILFTTNDPNPDPKDLKQLFDGPYFQLYQVIKRD
ncbi:MAG TPA: hypothetical protein VNL39_01580 [Xanthobacteraceae bacterium]|nr:hypothetical protein [Xanthobacteraceae bacterium]